MDRVKLAVVWQLIERIGTCVLVRWSAEGLKASPMRGAVDPAGRAIWLVPSSPSGIQEVDGEKNGEPHPSVPSPVCLAYADPLEGLYLAVSGRAEVVPALGIPAKDEAARGQAEGTDGRTERQFLRVAPDRAEVWDLGPLEVLGALQTLTATGPGRTARGASFTVAMDE